MTIPICYEDFHVNSFFPRTARLLNSLPIECFPLTHNLSGFKSRSNRHLIRFFLNWFPVCSNLFVLLFLLTPCLIVALQPCMEWIPIKKKSLNSGWISIYCYCSLSKSSECCFQCFIAAHLISSGCISINDVNAVSLNSGYALTICCRCTFNKHWVDFHIMSPLFHLIVYVIFHMFLLSSFKKQWI